MALIGGARLTREAEESLFQSPTANVKKCVTLLGLTLVSCSPLPCPFTHIDVEGPAPYVMFDQTTGRLCWAGQDTANAARAGLRHSFKHPE